MFNFMTKWDFIGCLSEIFIQQKNYSVDTPYLQNLKDELYETYRQQYKMYVAEYFENKHKLGIRRLVFDNILDKRNDRLLRTMTTPCMNPIYWTLR